MVVMEETSISIAIATATVEVATPTNKRKSLRMRRKKKAAGDAGKGEKIFNNLCAVCHSFQAHGTGPNLAGVVGRAPASAEGFAYSYPSLLILIGPQCKV